MAEQLEHCIYKPRNAEYCLEAAEAGRGREGAFRGSVALHKCALILDFWPPG